MATRQRTPSPRKSSSAPTISGEQLAGTPTNVRSDDSPELRATFDPKSFEDRDAAASDPADTARVRFVGEQVMYKDRYERIAEAAYLRAERRGFTPGYEIDDWLAAEREIDALLSRMGT